MDINISYRIGSVKVSVLASSAVGHGFESQLGQSTKDVQIGICCFSALHSATSSKSKD